MYNSKVMILFLPSMLLFFGICSQSYGQDSRSFIMPAPAIGWDSLHKNLEYNEIARRAGIQRAYDVLLELDSVGKVGCISISSLNPENRMNRADSSLIQNLGQILSFQKWSPARVDNRPFSCAFHIPIIFSFQGYGYVGPKNRLYNEPFIITAHPLRVDITETGKGKQ
jgi:hypothetical protein